MNTGRPLAAFFCCPRRATMTDRLLGKRDMAAMLGTSPGVAAFILEE